MTCVVAGHLCLDIQPTLHGPPTTTPGELQDVGPAALKLGGCVGNTAPALVALGSQVRVAATVANDPMGAVLVSLLHGTGCDTRAVSRDESGSTSYSVVMEPPGQDRWFLHHTGSNATFGRDQIQLQGVDLLHVGYLSLLPSLLRDDAEPLLRLLRAARRRRIVTSVDLATVDPDGWAGGLDWSLLLRRVLPDVDIITASVDDLRVLGSDRGPEEWAGELVDVGVAVAMVKAGPDGLVLRTAGPDRFGWAGRLLASRASSWANALVRCGAPPGPVVSTVGAGDTATAGLLHAVGLGVSPEVAATTATAAAAVVVTGRGRLGPHLVEDPTRRDVHAVE